VGDRCGAASEVTADEIFVAGFEVRGVMDGAVEDMSAEAGGELFDAGLDGIGEAFAVGGPAAGGGGGGVGVAVEGVIAGRCAGGVEEGLLTEDEVGVRGELVGADLGGEASEVSEVIAGVDDGGAAGVFGAPGDGGVEGPVDLEGAPALGEAPHGAADEGGDMLGGEHLEVEGGGADVGEDSAGDVDLVALGGAYGDGAALADDDFFDAFVEANLAAVGLDDAAEGVGDGAGAALGDAEAGVAGEEAEDEADGGAGEVIGADVGVEAEGGEDAASGGGGEAALAQAAP